MSRLIYDWTVIKRLGLSLDTLEIVICMHRKLKLMILALQGCFKRLSSKEVEQSACPDGIRIRLP